MPSGQGRAGDPTDDSSGCRPPTAGGRRMTHGSQRAAAPRARRAARGAAAVRCVALLHRRRRRDARSRPGRSSRESASTAAAGPHSWSCPRCAAIAQLFVVRTTRDQSYHTSTVFLIAGALLLPPELVVLMGVVQHVPEWLKHRYPWYMQTFNIANYTLDALAAWGVARLVLGPDAPRTGCTSSPQDRSGRASPRASSSSG